jgi:hypothetical protein
VTQEQREALKGAVGIWSMDLTHGVCAQGVVHYALDECEPALCGATMVDDIWEKTFELLLPAVRHSSSNTCPECAAKAEELAAAALEALTAPGHEEALADLAAENERLKRALSLACSEVYRLHECCPSYHRCARPDDCHQAACGGNAITPGTDGGDIEVAICAIECWEEHYLAEAKAQRKAGDAQ